MTSTDQTGRAIRTAAVVAGLMIAFQVASRATRDALYLSHFDVTTLPRMVALAAAVALGAAVVASRVMGRLGPARLMPLLFAGSAVLQLLEWGLLRVAPAAASVIVYLHFNALGALLVSGFWSVVNERFDPRTGKRAAGSIGTAGTLGGVVGGLLAERAGALVGVSAVLPALAVVHAACAVLVSRMTDGTAEGVAAARVEPAGLRVLAASPYLRMLATVVLLGTVGEGLLDYVLKAAAQGTLGRGDDLLRLFAVFYTATNVFGFAVSAAFGSRALARLGLARTLGLLPWSIALGGVGALAVPGLGSALFAKGTEAVTRNSLYRLGYELLFTPIPPAEKRAAKPLLDVGAIRVGDMLAAAVVQVVLLAAATRATSLMLVLAVLAAAVAIWLTVGIHTGYITALERGLLTRAVQLDLDDVLDGTTRETLAHTAAVMRSGALPVLPERPAPAVTGTGLPDRDLARLADLRARDPDRVRSALRAGPLEPMHVAAAVTLLAWDAVSRDAQAALIPLASRIVGQLEDALRDPDTDFAVRRRLPAVLAAARDARAADALFAGLADARFEVRFRCGRALARLARESPDVAIEPLRVQEAVLREAAVDRRLWEGRQLLDEEADDPLELGDLVRQRASRSLEHVFTLLSLMLPRQPLQIAFRGLHTDDPQLRGTALEYLETALPSAIRRQLWPFIGDAPAPRRPSRPPEQVAAALLESRESIAANLRRRSGPQET